MNQQPHVGKTAEFWAFVAGLGSVLYGYFQPKCNFQPQDAVAIAILVGSFIAGRSYIKGKVVQAKPAATTKVAK